MLLGRASCRGSCSVQIALEMSAALQKLPTDWPNAMLAQLCTPNPRSNCWPSLVAALSRQSAPAGTWRLHWHGSGDGCIPSANARPPCTIPKPLFSRAWLHGELCGMGRGKQLSRQEVHGIEDADHAEAARGHMVNAYQQSFSTWQPPPPPHCRQICTSAAALPEVHQSLPTRVWLQTVSYSVPGLAGAPLAKSFSEQGAEPPAPPAPPPPSKGTACLPCSATWVEGCKFSPSNPLPPLLSGF